MGDHVELRFDRRGAGHEPRDGRARHRGGSGGDGLWPCGGDPRLDRLQPDRRRLRPAWPGDGVLRRGTGARPHLASGRHRARRRAAAAPGDAMKAMNPRKVGEGLYQPLAEINVTPLVDVMLVLLIIFMVTAPMLAAGIKVNLPSAKTAQPLETKGPVVVAVTKDGELSVGKDAVTRDRLA